MNYHGFAAALLLCACAPADEVDNSSAGLNGSAAANEAGPGEVPTLNGGPAPGTALPQQGTGQVAPDASGEIDFAASPDSVSQGGTVTLSLTNNSQQRLGYNLCTSAIQTAEGADVQTDRVCTMELRTLEPGRSATYAYELPGDIAPGRYRLTTTVTRMDAGTQATVSTGEFAVTAR